MLRVRLAPFGKKHQRHYRIVVTEGSKKITGHYLESLGHFHPLLPKSDPARFVIDKSRLSVWQKQGAQITDRIRKLL